MVNMYTITQYISNICLGIQQRSRVRPEKLICSHLGQVFWDIVSLCTGNNLGMVFSNETVVCLFWWLQSSFKVTLIHSSISAIVHNNVHKAFHPNLMFLSCGNNLLIVCDPSGVGDWSVCVKTCSCFRMLVCAWVNLKWYLRFIVLYFINVTESLIVLLIIIQIVLYVVIIKIFYFKKD